MNKTYFQDIHYLKKTPNAFLSGILSIGEFFYKNIINFKNFLYEKKFIKEYKVNAKVICIGNLTTGGVGKTPVVCALADELSKKSIVAIVSRGYGAKISNKKPIVIKDFNGIKFDNGSICGDEPYQLAKNLSSCKNVIIIICASKVLGAEYAIKNYNADTIILDDGFSNRTIKKDETYLLIDSKMRFGNEHLLPKGPLREPINQIKRADKIVIVNKGDEKITQAVEWAKNFEKPIKVSKMSPKKIYNMVTKAEVINYKNAIAFCAIGQSEQFFSFAEKYYNLVDTISYCDHYKYSESDIKKLILLAQKNNVHTFITTQKDEAKLLNLVKNISNYYFNVLELKTELEKNEIIK